MMRDSSPYDASASPRLFWQGRDSGSPFQRSSENQAPYDPEASFTTSKRPSIENLKSVSRVKNSTMFRDHKQEYDPTQIYVPQRPLATGRSFEKEDQISSASHHPGDPSVGPRPPSPSKDQASPAKSSLSKASRFGAKGGSFDPGSEIWSDIDGYRNAKSVTFDAAPPQINEYEMTTPDPSSIASGSHDGSYDSEEDEEVSFDRDSSMDRDDSFDASLEDIEKTPVVLPEDWRFMSPSSANDEHVQENEDPFIDEGSHSPEIRPTTALKLPAEPTRVESFDSNGERRPLPPLPSNTPAQPTPRPSSPGKLNAAFELGSGQRHLPAPPAPATHSKSDFNAPMSLEERLRLMMIQDDSHEPEASAHNENGGHARTKSEPGIKDGLSDKETRHSIDSPDTSARDGVFSPPRISRDSILRDIRKSDSFLDDSFEYSSQIDSSPRHYMHYDPDVPVPSVENDDDDTNSVIIKEEEVDEDIYAIPEYYDQESSKDLSFKDLHNQVQDDESHYSLNSNEELHQHNEGSDDNRSMPVPGEQAAQEDDKGDSHNAQTGMENVASGPKMAAMRQTLQRPVTPTGEDDQVSEPSTPDSVIRHPIDDESSDEQPIPEPIATVRAPQGSGLKIRPSFTPADLESMAATRRKVSGQQPPPMPLPDKEDSDQPQQPSNDAQPDEATETSHKLAPPAQLGKDAPQRQPSLVKLDIPFSIQEESLGFGLDKEFDRVIESQKVAFESSLSRSSNFPTFPATQTQDTFDLSTPEFPMAFTRPYSGPSADKEMPKQRGYLMRHNTKVIVASSRNDEESAQPNEDTPTNPSATKPASSPTRKVSQQTWTTEPWNGKTRRSSVRMASGIPKKKPVPGSAPPLPGQSSNVQGPSSVDEPEPALNEALEDGEERGRLFVKVVGMKYLDLPMPRGKTPQFSDSPRWKLYFDIGDR